MPILRGFTDPLIRIIDLVRTDRYFGSTGTSIAALGERAHWGIFNVAANNVLVVVHELWASHDTAGTILVQQHNAALTGDVQTFRSLRNIDQAANTQFIDESNAALQGQNLLWAQRLGANETTKLDLPFPIVLEGGFGLVFAELATDIDLIASAIIEEF